MSCSVWKNESKTCSKIFLQKALFFEKIEFKCLMVCVVVWAAMFGRILMDLSVDKKTVYYMKNIWKEGFRKAHFRVLVNSLLAESWAGCILVHLVLLRFVCFIPLMGYSSFDHFVPREKRNWKCVVTFFWRKLRFWENRASMFKGLRRYLGSHVWKTLMDSSVDKKTGVRQFITRGIL